MAAELGEGRRGGGRRDERNKSNWLGGRGAFVQFGVGSARLVRHGGCAY